MSGRSRTRTENSIRLLDLVVLAVSLTSLAAIVLVSVDAFRPATAAAIGVGATGVVVAVLRTSITLGFPRFRPLGLTVLATGLLFRIDRFPHLIGGQDQGLYTNYAIELGRAGSLNFPDRMRSSLSGGLLELYDRFPVGGVRLIDPGHSLMTIDFYPLHPLWMSMFGSVVGDSRQTISLLFFAWLGAVMAMGIAAQLLPGSSAPLIAAAFIAVNPALAFFAKFPVSESAAAAFSLAGFNYLLRAARAEWGRARWVHLVTCVASFGALCFVRFQLFLYLPFFALLVLLAVTRYFSRATRGIVVAAVGLSVALLLVSVAFYRSKQPVLYEIAMLSISPHVHASMLAAAALAVTVLVASYGWSRHRGRWHAIDRAVDALLRHAGLVFILALLASVPSIIELYRTGALTPWTYTIEPSGDRWLVRYHSLWRFMLFLTPAGFATLLGVALWRGAPRLVGAAMLFLALCWVGVLTQPYVPYLYYYGRYLVSDIVPIALVVCAVVIAHLVTIRRRVVAGALVVLIIGCSLPFSTLQIGHVESERVGFASELASRMGDNDVTVFRNSDDRILLPLRLAYDRQTMVIPEPTATDVPGEPLFLELFSTTALRGGRTFLALPVAVTHPGLRLEMSGTFAMGYFSNTEHWRDGTFQSQSRRHLLLPTTNIESSQEWFVYEVDSTFFAA